MLFMVNRKNLEAETDDDGWFIWNKLIAPEKYVRQIKFFLHENIQVK